MQSTPLTRPPFVAGSVPEYRTPELLINGQWRPGRGALRIAVCNPATEEPLGDFSSASTEDLAEALAASEVGFAAWRQRPARERAERVEAPRAHHPVEHAEERDGQGEAEEAPALAPLPRRPLAESQEPTRNLPIRR